MSTQVVGKYYLVGDDERVLDGPCETYLGALKVWFFYHPRSARVKQWTASGWKVPIALWVNGAWQGS